jgi:nitroreductase
MSELLEKLQWRYATKENESSQTGVPGTRWIGLSKRRRLAPAHRAACSHLKSVVVKHPELRERIRAKAWNQAQITDCSHLLVFAASDHYTPERINMMFDLTNTVRDSVNEGWEAYRQQLLNTDPRT